MNADTLSTIEHLQQQTTEAGVMRVVSDAIAHYGFDRLIITGLPDPGLGLEPLVRLSSLPEDWLARYAALNYVHHDPIARHCFTANMPFQWADVVYDAERNPLAHKVMLESREHGLTNGICVPVNISETLRGVVSFVGPSRSDPRHGPQVHLLALYAYEQLRQVAFIPQAAQKRLLTARETEVLKWVAMGKSAPEIATIMDMSERTVNQHCENAQRRLQTSNRVHTVVEAVRHGLVRL